MTAAINSKKDDPRLIEGVSSYEDDMTDEEWFSLMGPAEPDKAKQFTLDLSDKSIPLDVLWKVAEQAVLETSLAEIAHNPNITSELIDFLLTKVRQSDSRVIVPILQNDKTSSLALFKMWINNKFQTYRTILLKNPNTPPSVFWFALIDSDTNIQTTAKEILNESPSIYKDVLVYGLQLAGATEVSTDLPLVWLETLSETFGISLLV